MNYRENDLNVFALSKQLSNFVTQFCVLFQSLQLLCLQNYVTERAKLC